MRTPTGHALLALPIVMIASLTAEDTDAAKADLTKFQGEWSMVSGMADGQAVPEAMLATARRVCKDDETTVTIGGQLILKAKFTLDPTKRPKAINYEVTDGPTKGRKHRGIYEVDKENLRFCFAAPDAERPTTFESKPGDLHTYSVWKRAKDASP